MFRYREEKEKGREAQSIGGRTYNIKWKIAETGEFLFLEFDIQTVLDPNDLKYVVESLKNVAEIEPHNLRGRGVVISGRGPIWLYSALVHHLHYAPWIATYDPRLGGGVVASHVRKHEVGDVIPINYNTLSFRNY